MISTTPIQEQAIEKIVNYYFNDKKIVQFIAPTGSGKTFMIANVIDRILSRCSNEKICFIIFTLSDAELPSQFENKLLEYRDCLNYKYSVKHCSSPSTSKNTVKDNDYQIPSNYDVLIFGTHSFRKGTIFSELGRFRDLIQEKKDNGYKIIYIRDEAHIGDKNNCSDGKSEQELINKEANFIIKMTATPNSNIENAGIVIINEKDLNNSDDGKYLLKKDGHFNIGFSKNVITDDNDILDTAIDVFKDIKNKYYKKSITNNNIINPCMLIQISSKNQDGESVSEYDNRINSIVKKLDDNNLSWVIYLNDRKETSLRENINKNDKSNINLKSISRNNSNVDVVIFKIGPSVGWDIPRACMLVQLRKVCSDKLNRQVIGRIKRNPNKDLQYDDLYMQYWVYSDHQEKTREVHKYVLKEKFSNITFPSIIAIDKKIDESDEKYNELYDKHIHYFLEGNLKKIIDIYNETFPDNLSVLINEIRYSSNEDSGTNYEIRFNNILEIKKYIIKTFDKNNWLKKIKLDDFYNENLKDYMNKDQFYFILCRDYLNLLTEITNGFFSHNEKYGINYNNVLPSNFIVYEGKDSYVDFEQIKELYGYRYSLIEENSSEYTIQYLDSKPEEIYFKYLMDEIKKRGLENTVEVFVKNPLASTIYLEYWNKKELKYSKAYVDFIIKIKNKNIYLFIEVKSENDYDKEKTNSIIEQFELYKKHIKNSNVNIFLSVVFIDKDEKSNSKRIKEKPGVWINDKDNNFDYSSLKEFLDNIKN